MTRNPRAFSLIEALLTMTLMATVLGIAGGLMRSYSDNIRFAAAKDNEFLALQMGFDRVGAELRGSLSLLSPPPGSTATNSSLTFQELDPTFTVGSPAANPWLPSVLPTPLPSTPFNAIPAAKLLQINVFADPASQILWREVGPAGSAPVNRFVLAQGISAFNATILPSGAIQLQVQVQQTATSGIFTTQILRALP